MKSRYYEDLGRRSVLSARAVDESGEIARDPRQLTMKPEIDEDLTDEAYRSIAAFRAELRRFVRFSENAARDAGLTPQQHQLLIAIRGNAGNEPPTIGDVAEALQIKHHSAVGLVDRLVDAGLVRRTTSSVDSRRVHLVLEPAGRATLQSLAAIHRQEYRQLEEVLRGLVGRFEPPSSAS
jgi:DNA-binding MarR family transcriptional regulator